jgi:hypothetical protein
MKRSIEDKRQLMSRGIARTRDGLINLMDEEIASLPEDQRASAKFAVGTYGDGFDDNVNFALFMKWQRPETSEEENARETREKSWKMQQEIRDRAELARLQKKFGVKNDN